MSDFLKYRLLSRLIENIDSTAKAEENVEKLICDKTFSTSLSERVDELCKIMSFSKQSAAHFVSSHKDTQMETFCNSFDHRAGQHSLAVQELMVMEDIISLIFGVSGSLLYFDAFSKGKIVCDDSVFPTILSSSRSLLGLSQDLEALREFCRYTEAKGVQSKTINAFLAVCWDFIHGCETVAVYLEGLLLSGKLSIRSADFILRKEIDNMDMMKILVEHARNASHDLTLIGKLELMLGETQGNKEQFEYLTHILQRISRPFLNSLLLWLGKGILEKDEINEFFIKKSTVFDEAQLHSGFHVLSDIVPPSLHDLSDSILCIGSWINILKTHSISLQVPLPNSDCELSAQMIAKFVPRIRASVDLSVMNLLKVKERMLSTFELCCSLYFAQNHRLIEDSLAYSENILKRNIKSVDLKALDSALSSLELNLFTEQQQGTFSFYLHEFSLQEELTRIFERDATLLSNSRSGNVTGLDCLSIKLQLPFPESLLFPKSILSKYELIFRLILRLIVIQRNLKLKFRNGVLSLARKGIQSFVMRLYHFIVYDVLEPNRQLFIASLDQSKGIEQVIRNHESFIDSCLRQIGLMNPKLISLLNHALTQCENFHDETGGIPEADLLHKFNSSYQAFIEGLKYFSSRDYDYTLSNLLARYC